MVERSEVEQLKAVFRGRIFLPADAGYDIARQVWNGMIDRRPAVIAQCVGTSDVKQAVDFARTNNLIIAVRGGGHNVAGNSVCDGGMMIDLSLMRSAFVNPQTKTVRVAGGALLADLDSETQLYGLAVSAGVVSHTGVAGLTLGGGFGWISRKYGLSVDNLISAQVVTADGRVLTASKDENSDLFWGIRGGGGNFGIVTSFEFHAAKIGQMVYSGVVVYPGELARDYIRFHREYVRTLPDEMTVWFAVRHAPPLPFLPAGVHGHLAILIPFIYIGEQSKGEELIRPVREFNSTHWEAIGMHPWVQWQSLFNPLAGPGARNYWKSHHLKGLPDECIDIMLDFINRVPTPQCELFVPHMEGAASRVPANETAYALRKAPFVMNVHTRWENAADDEKCIAWARQFFEATKKFAEGVYVNFLSDEGAERVRDAYPKETWERLVQLKNKYDPKNLFCLNQNIKPTV